MEKNENKILREIFDVSFLELSYGVFEVKAIDNGIILGGEVIDTVLQKLLTDQFKNNTGIYANADKMTRKKDNSIVGTN